VQETRLDIARIRAARRVIDPVFLDTPLYRCEALEPVHGKGSGSRPAPWNQPRLSRQSRRSCVPASASQPVAAAVDATGLAKTFGRLRAVDGIDLHVRQGEISGVLGPNGAGKTTAPQMLATLLPIDAGQARVFGVDVIREPHRVRQLIGATGQFASVEEDLTATENLWMFGRLQGLRSADARACAKRLLAQFDLEEATDRPVAALRRQASLWVLASPAIG
jgi:ABC-type glutathione transport system ATPase component